MRYRSFVLALTLALFVGACADCAGVGRPALAVWVVNAENSSPVALGATLFLFRHSETLAIDSMTGREDTEALAAGFDQKGRFDAVVEKPGYFPWTAQNVAVGGACSVETVFLTARLRRRSA